jgi:hypothetical protein
VNHTQVGDAGLAHFKGMPLMWLWIDDTGITDLNPLQGMLLEEIHLTPKNITRGLDILRDMKSLKTIGIAWERDWPAAEFWERYDRGEFGAAPFTDADRRAAEYVLSIGGAVRVNDNDSDIRGPRGALPRGVFRLTYVDLHENDRATDSGLAVFKGCKNLTFLQLDHTPVGDAGLVHFQDGKALTHLFLAGTQVSNRGLAHFKDCKNLIDLRLESTQVGDAGLAHFKGMPLKVLWIDNTGITDLTPLQGMPLDDIRLTPKNVTRGLDILRDMKSLKTIGTDHNQAWPAAEFWERYDKGEFK